jgi:hypothetical protein
MDMYCRLSKRSEEASFPERHNPYSEFRQQVAGLVQDARALLNDTMVKFLGCAFNLNLIAPVVLQNTTVPFMDEIGFDPKKLKWGTARPSR